MAPRCGCAGRRRALARRWREAWAHATTKASDVASALLYHRSCCRPRSCYSLRGTTRSARGRREDVPYATAEIVAAEVHWRGRVPTFETLSCCHDSVFDRTGPITTSSLWEMGLLDDQDIYQYKLLLYNVLPPFLIDVVSVFFLKKHRYKTRVFTAVSQLFWSDPMTKDL